jgi:hypothetical protein
VIVSCLVIEIGIDQQLGDSNDYRIESGAFKYEFDKLLIYIYL